MFTSWGEESARKFTREEVESILQTLSGDESYGQVLRSKGMVPAKDGTWIYFDMVPGECDIRSGSPEITGKYCVIGSKLDEAKLRALFNGKA